MPKSIRERRMAVQAAKRIRQRITAIIIIILILAVITALNWDHFSKINLQKEKQTSK